jgi:hypothetical protein
LASDPDIAYGKFFGRNAGFIARDFFPIFANYRRNGYDFDALFEDELASYRAKKIMDVFELDDENAGRQIMSSEVKELAGFGKGGGEKNFEGVLETEQCGAVFDRLVFEISKVVNFYNFSNPETEIRNIYLSGDGAGIDQLVASIATNFDYPVWLVNSLMPDEARANAKAVVCYLAYAGLIAGEASVNGN